MSGLRARRERRGREAAEHTHFVYEEGRRIGPVAERCGYGGPQFGRTSVVFCGDPVAVLRLHPWLDEPPNQAEVPADDPNWCVDMWVEWRDGWVELRADPFIQQSLFAPASDRDALGQGLDDVAAQLEDALDRQAVLEGAGRQGDPRPSDGSWGYLRAE